MKSEKIYDAITNIDDELIECSDSYKFKKKKNKSIQVIISAAAAFIIIVAIGFIIRDFDFEASNSKNENITQSQGVTENNKENNNTQTDNSVITAPQGASQMSLVSALYPERTKYPIEDERFQYNTDEYEKWYDEDKERSNIDFDDESINSFSFKLINEMLTGKEGENKAASPLNIYMALCVLAETCGGESREQILSLLGASSIEQLRDTAKKVWLKNYRNDGVMRSILANSIWLSDGFEYNKDTLELISNNYYASSFKGKMGSPEYNQMLNFWISQQTDGLLNPNIEMAPETLLCIASTLLFNSKWNEEFSPENTEKGIFNAPAGEKEVEYMKKTQSMQYFFGDKFSAVYLNLDIGGKMWFILPDEGVSADSIFADNEVQKLITTDFSGLWQYENSKDIRVNVSIPKFDVECKTDLIENLKNLGVTDITDSSVSDFSPLCGKNSKVFVDKAEHGVRVKADEEGISAAAYTVIMECGSTMPPDEIVDFTLDRPFAFAITFDNDTILFAGVVNNP